MKGECGICMYAIPSAGPDGKIDFTAKIGRRNPPQVFLLPTQGGLQPRAVWPTVGIHDVCGQYAVNPESLS